MQSDQRLRDIRTVSRPYLRSIEHVARHCLVAYSAIGLERLPAWTCMGSGSSDP